MCMWVLDRQSRLFTYRMANSWMPKELERGVTERDVADSCSSATIEQIAMRYGHSHNMKPLWE